MRNWLTRLFLSNARKICKKNIGKDYYGSGTLKIMKPLIILLLVLSISFTGCVKSNLDNSGVKNVKIGYQHSDLHSALFVADEKGILAENESLFEKYGINATLIEFTGGPVEMQALGAGEIDIAYVGTAPTLTYIDKTYKDRRVSAHIIAGLQTGGI